MKFKTAGNPNGNAVLLIHAMFVTSESFSPLIDFLKEDYFLIMPTLDGHDIDESSAFLSVKDEADKILAYLQKNNIKNLDFILGTSLGAIIAFEVYQRNAVHVDKIYLDGGPFFNFGPLLQKIVFKKLWNICSKIKQSPQNGVNKLDKIFPGLGNLMSEVCCHMTKENVRSLVHACYSFTLPKLSEAAQKPVVFLYGTKEPARMCIFRLKKYKYSRIVKKIGYSHCGYLLSHPKEYAEMLIGNLN